MKARSTTIWFEALMLIMILLALSNIGLTKGERNFLDGVRLVAVEILLYCPYVVVLMVYSLVPLWRSPSGMDFLHAGGLGAIGLLWTSFITGWLTG